MKIPRPMQWTMAALAVTAFWALSAQAEDAKLPPIKPLFDYPLRDTSVCVGGDGMYYLTGTTGDTKTWWDYNDGAIRVWKSSDLKTWKPLGAVWTVEKGTWQKAKRNGKRSLWAPEIHYIKGTYWLTFCMNFERGGTGLLKSTSGKPEGPYIDVHPQGPLTDEIDASLFADDDGKVYFVFQNGKIARLNEAMTELAEKPRVLKPWNADQVGFEGAFITKIKGRYVLICAEWNDRLGAKTYDCMAATAKSIYGPYGPRYLAISHGGHNMLFKDKQGQWWSTFFGSDPKAPFQERPGIIALDVDDEGHIRPKTP
jgi:xylan 1,4-beta-xylosidase